MMKFKMWAELKYAFFTFMLKVDFQKDCNQKGGK